MVGRVTSEGDRAMRSNRIRSLLSIDGAGIKIGVISDSYNAQRGAAVNVATGDLPGRSNPNGYTQPVRVLQDRLSLRSDEGRAMLQIIHDVAPGATLLFHSTGNTEEDFAAAVRGLVQAGADIIVDDIGFSTTPFFQDGVAAQAVDAAVQQGVVYFSSAGNNSDRAYQSPFRPGATFTYRGDTYEAHDFDLGSGIDLFQDMTLPQASSSDIRNDSIPRIDLLLSWDQAVGKVTTDLELFLVSSPQLPNTGNLLSQSALFSPRVDAPLQELIYATSSAQTVYLVIAKRVNANRSDVLFKWSNFANGGDEGVKYQYVNDAGGTGGSTIMGQANARSAIAVGAAAYMTTPAFGGEVPVLESFSSRGGTPILFNAQGERLATPEVRQKPELVAPDRVSTSLTSPNLYLDFSSFAGTSAAAPHVAAVAALMLQRAGGNLSPAQVLAALQKTALPMDEPGNFSSGAGFVQADAAVLQSFLAEIRGSDRSDRLMGTRASDNLYGLAGSDRLMGGSGLDVLFGGLGRDTLNGGSGNDYLVGERGNDSLWGATGDDWLSGDEGNDRLMGGRGNNRLVGGKGADLFALDRRGLALIQDFRKGHDRLALPQSLGFSQLDVVQQGRDTLIQFRGGDLAILSQFRASALTIRDIQPAVV